MKKIIALLLCSLLLFACVLTFAESTDPAVLDISSRIQLKGNLPSGYNLSIISQSDLELEGIISSADSQAPVMHVYVSFNESYAGITTLNDLSSDTLERIKQTFTEEYTVSFDQFDTAAGARMLMTCEAVEQPDFLDFYTIFLGHEIEFTLVAGDGAADRTLSGDQISRCREFVKTLELIPGPDPS